MVIILIAIEDNATMYFSSKNLKWFVGDGLIITELMTRIEKHVHVECIKQTKDFVSTIA